VKKAQIGKAIYGFSYLTQRIMNPKESTVSKEISQRNGLFLSPFGSLAVHSTADGEPNGDSASFFPIPQNMAVKKAPTNNSLRKSMRLL